MSSTCEQVRYVLRDILVNMPHTRPWARVIDHNQGARANYLTIINNRDLNRYMQITSSRVTMLAESPNITSVPPKYTYHRNYWQRILRCWCRFYLTGFSRADRLKNKGHAPMKWYNWNWYSQLKLGYSYDTLSNRQLVKDLWQFVVEFELSHGLYDSYTCDLCKKPWNGEVEVYLYLYLVLIRGTSSC